MHFFYIIHISMIYISFFWNNWSELIFEVVKEGVDIKFNINLSRTVVNTSYCSCLSFTGHSEYLAFYLFWMISCRSCLIGTTKHQKLLTIKGVYIFIVYSYHNITNWSNTISNNKCNLWYWTGTNNWHQLCLCS